MKRFIVSVLCVSVFCIGLGALVEKVGASFKSDEKALALLQKARQAIGGESAVANVRSLTIVGKTTKTLEFEGVTRNEPGELEINLELPNKMNKMIKIGSGEGQLVDKQFDVMIMRKDDDNLRFKIEAPEGATEGAKKIVIKKQDGTNEDVTSETREPLVIRRDEAESADGRKVFVRKQADVLEKSEAAGAFHRNELLRTTLALLLTAPEGMDVSYAYAGEGQVDGASCEIIDAQVAGTSIKLYLDKSTSLPRMMTFQGAKPFMIKIDKAELKAEEEGAVKVFERRALNPETAEFQVKFSDYRSVNGLQLPFRWTQTVGGKADETVDITSYEINPANISEKFREMPRKTFPRMPKEQ